MASRKKSELLVARVTPEIKKLAQRLAEREHRNLSNWLEVLVIEKAREAHLTNNGNGERS